MRVNPVKVRALCLTSIATLLLGACGNSTSTGGGTALAPSQVLRFPVSGDFGTFDPAHLNAETDQDISINLFDGLLKFDDQLKPVPDIASEIPSSTNGGISSDGLTYTFKLRPEAKFSNGDRITASDVLYSWNRAASEGQDAYGSDFDHVVGYDDVSKKGATVKTMSGLTSTDDHTVVVKLKTKWSVFLTEVAFSSAAPIISKKAVDQDPTNWWGKPETEISSGPYHMTARSPGQSIEFTAVSNYWGAKKPVVNKVQIDVVKDMASAIVKYDQGGYDTVGYGGMSGDLPPDNVQAIQANAQKATNLHIIPKGRSVWVAYDFLGPSAFTGLTGAAHDLRLALSLAIDRNQMADLACAKALTCKPATGGLISKGLKAYGGDNSDPTAKFDLPRAKQLLASADPDGSKTKNLVYVTDTNKPVYKNVAENLIAQWKQNLGINVTEQVVDHSPFIKQYTGHKIRGPHREGWQPDYDHPQDWFDNLFTCGADSNGSSYCNPKLDDLVHKADALPLEEAIPQYQAALKIMEDDAAFAPLIYTAGTFLWKPYLQGIGSNNFQDYYWNEVSILQH